MPRKAAEKWWSMPITGAMKQYCIENGIKVPDRSKPFKAPPEVCYYYKDYGVIGEEWKVKTWKEVFAERKQRQDRALSFKRNYDEYGKEKIKPCYIWVFDNRKMNWFFSDVYFYVVTTKKTFALNFREGFKKELIEKIMQLFPLGVEPSADNMYEYAEKFIQTYNTKGAISPKMGERPEGKVVCWCKVGKYGILDIEDVKNLL